MSYALLGVIVVVALLALVAIFMSIKTWHWAQMLLVLGVFMLSLVALFLSAEVLRIHKALRSGIPNLEKQLVERAKESEALRFGTSDVQLMTRIFGESPFDESVEEMPGIDELNHRLQISARRLGRLWNGVQGAGFQNGIVTVNIPEGQPALTPNAILYAFEIGAPQGADPLQGAQYLGEFKVTGPNQLQPVQRLTERTGRRLTSSQRPWRLYETMPADRHDLFEPLGDEQLQVLLPPASVQDYVDHGQPYKPEQDPRDKAGFDEEGNRVGPDEVDSAPDQRYDRPLRSYAYLFEEFDRQRTLLLAQLRETSNDIKKLKQADANAKQLSAYREQELKSLAIDRKGMQRDRDAIKMLLAEVQLQLQNATRLLQRAMDANEQLADELTRRQLSRLQAFDVGTVRPAGQP